jgi:Fur family transcriptional regulator, stress-responsive regulator
MSDLLQRLRERSTRLTSQRRVIAEILDGPDTHLTAEEVLERARATLPEIGLTTVYKTLNEFAKAGDIRQLVLNDGVKRYDPNNDDHHHLVCLGCDRILDVSVRRRPSLSDDKPHGFEIRSVEVTFRGLCGACAADGDAS